MGYSNMFRFLFLSWVFLIQSTHELQNSQTQVLLQLRKHLEFPSALETWVNYNEDLCNISPTTHMSISCQDDSVAELKIMGNRLFKSPDLFNGFAIPNQTLSESFSIDSLVTTLTRLSSLRVLSLVSLGVWGELPGKMHRLSFLEYLDLSSNYLFGSIPPEISRLVRLQTLILDWNYFNGSVPDNLDSLSDLTVLSLKSNRLKGPFPSSVCRISALTNIALSHNQILGRLPGLSQLANLHVLDLRENHLDSELPMMPKSLVTVLISKNLLWGDITGHFGQLDQLQHLDLSFNHFTGTPPSALFSLPNISFLDLSSNKLTGKLPKNLICGSKLGLVDLSNNRLMGELPTCLESVSGERVVNLGGNCFSFKGDQNQHQELFCKENIGKRKQSRGRTIRIWFAVVGGAVLILAFLAFGSLLLYRKCCSRQKSEQQTRPKVALDGSSTGVSSQVHARARLISQAAKLETQGSLSCRSFSFEELKEATNNFDSSTFMGEGSIGKLYRGKLENGTYVAIRILALSKKFSVQRLNARLDWLSKLHHPHLVSLLGHCIETSGQDDYAATQLFLVYEYVPNGNYRTHLSESCQENVLTWPERIAILIEVAKAVHFLHTGVIPGSVNNRLRTNKILLDQHRIAKLCDYGLSIITEANEKLNAKGETQKSRKAAELEDDVYNFGFVLLESLVGTVVSRTGEAFLLNEITSFGSQDGRRRIIDPIVLTTSSQESLSIVVSITNKCVSPEPSSRPSFEDVLWNLQYAAQVQAAADADQKSDSTS